MQNTDLRLFLLPAVFTLMKRIVQFQGCVLLTVWNQLVQILKIHRSLLRERLFMISRAKTINKFSNWITSFMLVRSVIPFVFILLINMMKKKDYTLLITIQYLLFFKLEIICSIFEKNYWWKIAVKKYHIFSTSWKMNFFFTS
jgi:hypothetical protein